MNFLCEFKLFVFRSSCLGFLVIIAKGLCPGLFSPLFLYITEMGGKVCIVRDCFTRSLEGPRQYLLTVLLSILFNYLPWANDTTPALLLMWCGKPAKWLTWACIALYRTVKSLIQIWFHHFFTSLALIHFYFQAMDGCLCNRKFKGISDFRNKCGLFFASRKRFWNFGSFLPIDLQLKNIQVLYSNL